jgi:hypothetical protein
MKAENHAIQNAQGWTDTIRSLVAALECYDRLAELRGEREALAEEITTADQAHTRAEAENALFIWDTENGDELRELIEAATVDGDEMKDADSVRERILESPLSVQVRSGWHNAGEPGEAEDFEILLSTGGPALRIVGELDEHKQPHRAWLEYQDWSTPWTHHHVDGFADTLLTFCQQFYFGE